MPSPLRQLNRDGRLLFTARVARMFGYGFLAVVLALYLAALGLDEARIGLLLTLTLVGDTAISLWMSTQADRLGRRRMLVLGSLLVLGAGLLLSSPALMSGLFFVAGGLKIVYDLLLLLAFRSVNPPEERDQEKTRRQG